RRHRRVSLREELANVASRPTAVAALQAERFGTTPKAHGVLHACLSLRARRRVARGIPRGGGTHGQVRRDLAKARGHILKARSRRTGERLRGGRCRIRSDVSRAT